MRDQVIVEKKNRVNNNKIKSVGIIINLEEFNAPLKEKSVEILSIDNNLYDFADRTLFKWNVSDLFYI